ncbi:MAG: GNAT family N-acetyltransferase [Myxococcota bacterium]|nr:GNAT family N-acetyltransferase [Myxococcota bacterium]
MLIRDAILGDAPAFATLVVACWRTAYRGVLPDEALDREDHAARVIRIEQRMRDGWTSYAAERGGRVTGLARLAARPAHGHDAELEGLYVDPAVQRTGVGRALLRHACTRLAAAGQRTLYIHTLRDNPGGRAFYERLGGELVIEDTWSFEAIAYPAVGYRWPDLATLC